MNCMTRKINSRTFTFIESVLTKCKCAAIDFPSIVPPGSAQDFQ